MRLHKGWQKRFRMHKKDRIAVFFYAFLLCAFAFLVLQWGLPKALSKDANKPGAVRETGLAAAFGNRVTFQKQFLGIRKLQCLYILLDVHPYPSL